MSKMTENVESAAVTEATRLCDQAFAGLAKLSADPAVATHLPPLPSLLAKAKRYQLHEFRPDFARIRRMVSDLVQPCDNGLSREEYESAINLFCAAGIAEVERRFRSQGS